MSEFSESFHLLTNSVDDAKNLLIRAKLHGFVGDSDNGWAIVLPEGEPFSEHSELINSNTGILLQYIFAEDHGFGFALYENTDPVCIYWCDFDKVSENGINSGIDTSRLDLNTFTSLLNIKDKLFVLNSVLKPKNEEDIYKINQKFYDIVGLNPYNVEWVSYHYQQLNQERNEGIQLTEVNRNLCTE
ncbi:MAG TPA: hypothetical protein VHO94_02455 [Oscillospiraceae bacterium]|nr:hypothetical protein [Oscillospiraceae bacterium]